MQVENHKEEVPFEHYQGLFEQADAAEMAKRSGAKWDGKEFLITLLGKTYGISHPVYSIREYPTSVTADAVPPINVGMLATGKHKDFGFAARSTTPQGEGLGNGSLGKLGMTEEKTIPSGQGSNEKIGTVHAVSAATCRLPVQTFLLRYLLEGKAVAWQGGWKTFREMPWGELYIKPYTGRVLTRAAFTFGTRVEAFRAACEKMGAVPLKHGDAGYELKFLGDYAMRIMVWEGDDEFPPNAQVLYSDNFETGFAPEDRVVAGDILITEIKSRM